MPKVFYKSYFDSPLGQMLAISDNKFLYLLEFTERKNLDREIARLKTKIQLADSPISRQIKSEIVAYFAGNLTQFRTPIHLPGTDFQQQVWRQVEQVTYGQTVTYQDIANKIGKPKASMAVGSANGANQFVILIPCHRLIRTDGGLAGYAAGLWRKAALLKMERDNYERKQL